MENGVSRGVAGGERALVAQARDATGALVLAELLMVQHIDSGGRAVPSGALNAFGDRVALLPPAEPEQRVERARERAAAGERATLLATAGELSRARLGMAKIAEQRLSVVFHVIEPSGVEAAFALADLGWGMLFADGVEESFDLSLVARRASEDSGTPFLVVHERSYVSHLEPLRAPGPDLIVAFIGAAATRLRRLDAGDAAHPAHAPIGARGFAERVPFALGSAFRELDALTGRKHDLVSRSQAGDAPFMLVGLGPTGGVLLGEVDRLRAAGHDVGAVKLTAFRPFPGARLVRMLARAMAISVLEGKDEPLAQSNPLTREVKAAFADALTWAPDYPGIGRIPRIHGGVVHGLVAEVGARDLDAVVHNMLDGDHGKRCFALRGDAEESLSRRAATPSAPLAGRFQLIGFVRDVAIAEAVAELLVASVASVFSLHTRASTRKEPHGGAARASFEAVVSSERPRGVYVAPAVSLVVVDDPAWLALGNPLLRLAPGGIVAVASKRRSEAELWSDMPPYVKAIIFDRHAHLRSWDAGLGAGGDGEEARWLAAAGVIGVLLAALTQQAEAGTHVDASLVERAIIETIQALGVGGDVAMQAGQLARAAFESHLTVARGVVEGDLESVRLGRRDARAAMEPA
jgi:pyruvate/2-oxoacid:ferredoxin oxidoreductase alpha subunit